MISVRHPDEYQMMRLDNQIMPGNGSRRFAAFRAVGGYLLLKKLVSELPSARIVGYVEGITEMWLDFESTLPKRDQYADDVHDARVALGRLIPVRTSSSGTKKPATENDGDKPRR